MARKTVLVSDLSGDIIADGKGATARVVYTDQRKGVREMHLTDAEADRMFEKARRAARRGRRPQAAEPGA